MLGITQSISHVNLLSSGGAVPGETRLQAGGLGGAGPPSGASPPTLGTGDASGGGFLFLVRLSSPRPGAGDVPVNPLHSLEKQTG